MTKRLLNYGSLLPKTIDEILTENEEMRREIVRLNDVITNNITELSLRLDAETEDRIGIFLIIDCNGVFDYIPKIYDYFDLFVTFITLQVKISS